MNIDEHLMMVVATVLYGVAMIYSVFLWRKGFTRDDTIIIGILAAGFVFHSIAMMTRAAETQSCPINNLFEVTVFTSWLVGTGFVVGSCWSRLRSLGAFVSPVVFGMSLMSLFPNVDGPEDTLRLEGWYILHVPIILLAYGAFTLAGVASVMYLTHSHYLRHNKEKAFWVQLPSIYRLEQTASVLLTAGVILLTIGLGLGFMILKVTTGTYISPDAKIYWSLVVWGGYLALLLVHRVFGIRGRYLAWSCLGLLVFVLTTFWGANLLSDIHNAKPVSSQDLQVN